MSKVPAAITVISGLLLENAANRESILDVTVDALAAKRAGKTGARDTGDLILIMVPSGDGAAMAPAIWELMGGSPAEDPTPED